MIRVVDILKLLEEIAPPRFAASYDNVGHIVGRRNSEVKKIVVALDITSNVIDEAISSGANLIVSHHPVIFGKRSTVTDSDVTGSLILKLAENGISAICMHTNLDCAKDGVNDVLADALSLCDTAPVEPQEDGTVGCGRVGVLSEEKELGVFLAEVCKALKTRGLKYHSAGNKVRKVIVGGGSCGDYISLAKSFGCDTVVTADIKHNQFIEAAELHINAIDAGHFATEDVVCPYICEVIRKAFPSIPTVLAKSDKDCTEFFTV